jgi:hypothetical protein
LVLFKEQKRRAQAWRATPAALEGATPSSS